VRVHASSSPIKKLRDFKPTGSFSERCGDKPYGLWYGHNDAWLRWCLSERFNTHKYKHFYSLGFRGLKILRINSEEKLRNFTEGYAVLDQEEGAFLGIRGIDWEEVISKFDGIEIVPYIHACRLDLKTRWYYGWDVAGGCVWSQKVTLKELPSSHRFVRRYVNKRGA